MSLPVFPMEASTVAPQVDALTAYALLIVVSFIALVGGLISYFALKYHHSARADRSQPLYSIVLLDGTWSVIPLLLCLAIFGWGAKLFIAMRQPPPDALEVYSRGKAVGVGSPARRGPRR